MKPWQRRLADRRLAESEAAQLAQPPSACPCRCGHDWDVHDKSYGRTDCRACPCKMFDRAPQPAVAIIEGAPDLIDF